MTTKTILAPTAALVLQMGLPIYQEAATKKYLSLVDMSSGEEMFKKFRTSLHLLNRKFFIRKTLLQILNESPMPIQWVVIAAGMCPMPLEILPHVPEKILRVFEIDVAFMPEKQKLYQAAAPTLANKISCITADIATPNLAAQLQHHGFMPNVPTFVQMEGITYYLPGKTIQKIISEFASPQTHNWLVADFLLPYDVLSETGRSQGEFIFGTISQQTGFSEITHFTIDDFKKFLALVSGKVVDHKTTYDLEILRTGGHAETAVPKDGLIDIVLGKL